MPTFPPRPRLTTVAVVIAGLLAFALRRPEGLMQATIWAEDGRVFWAEALHPSPHMVSDYAAQWWTAQRLVMLAVVQAPVEWAPVLIYLAACLVAVLAAATILQQRAGSLFGRYRYQVLAFVLVLAVPAAWEVHGNLTNIQVWLAVGLLVVLVLPAPVSLVGRCAEMGFVLVSGLTGFLGVLLSPLALWSLVRMRGRYTRARAVLVLGAAVCNVVVWLTAGRAAQDGSLGRLLQVPETLAFRWGGGSVLGEYPLRTATGDQRHLVVLAVGALFLGVVLVAAWIDRKGPSPIWLLPPLLWAVLAILSPTGAVGSDWMFDPQAHWRYFALGVVTGLLVLVRAVGTVAVRWPFWLALAACVPAILVGLRLPAMGPALPREEVRAFGQCLQIPGGVCMLDIAPGGWTVVVLVP